MTKRIQFSPYSNIPQEDLRLDAHYYAPYIPEPLPSIEECMKEIEKINKELRSAEAQVIKDLKRFHGIGGNPPL